MFSTLSKYFLLCFYFELSDSGNPNSDIHQKSKLLPRSQKSHQNDVLCFLLPKPIKTLYGYFCRYNFLLLVLHKKWSFPLRISSVNLDLVSFTEEILNGKLHFLCSLTSLAKRLSIHLWNKWLWILILLQPLPYCNSWNIKGTVMQII